ncbi:MAG: TraB/GumN family protein [Steroidobacteraceae bacterium]
MKARPIFISVIAGLLWSLTAHADEHVFWEVSGKHNTVYLLGSVHVLSNTDRALPAVADAAYLDAESIVEELDVFAAASEMSGGAALSLQTLPEGQMLAAVLGPELHARLQKAAAPLHIDTDFLTRMQPWFVAMMITQARLTQGGFNATDGVDFQIALRAQRDRKPLRGLETAVEQLSLFAAMSLADQREFLRATLDESDIAAQVAEIAAVWRRGDLKRLESLLRQGAEESPEFFKALTTDRNLRWLPQIEAMLADPKDDYLVVTGALHMVGDMGMVELLRRKGYKVERR